MRWKLAQAAIETNMPAVIGSVKSAPLCLAKYSRMASTVVYDHLNLLSEKFQETIDNHPQIYYPTFKAIYLKSVSF